MNKPTSPTVLPALTASHRRLIGQLAIARLQLAQQKAARRTCAADKANTRSIAMELTLVDLIGTLCGLEAMNTARHLLDWDSDDLRPSAWSTEDGVRWLLRDTNDQLAQLAVNSQPHAHPGNPVVTGQKGIM